MDDGEDHIDLIVVAVAIAVAPTSGALNWLYGDRIPDQETLREEE
jgi:hypothetical protein